jgi:hypothetical protein
LGSPRSHEWERRPALAKLVRAAAWVVPIVASVGAGLAVSFLVTRPEGLGVLVWWAAVAAGAIVTLLAFGPLARRTVTLAALLDVSLVFPSTAPSRLFAAWRASSDRRLQDGLIQTRTHNGVANARVAERMALAGALGALRQQKQRQTRWARAGLGAFVVAAALITGTLLVPAPPARVGLRTAGPAGTTPGPVPSGVPPPGPTSAGTEPATSPTRTPVAGPSNRAAGPTISQDRTAPPNEVGQAVSNRGITLTVTEVKAADSIPLNETNYPQGSGYETYTDTPAGPDAKYVTIKAHIINNTDESLDLTCGLSIKTLLIDDTHQQFDPIPDLDKIQGNPECNAQLQRGSESDMTWAYRVPANTHVTRWAFEDLTDMQGRNQYTGVRIQVPGA